MNKIGCVQHDCDECVRREAEFAAITAERNQLAEDINKLREFVGAQLAAVTAELDEYRAALEKSAYIGPRSTK